jgi:N-acyl homoserine lactone hydrolase
MSLLVRREGKAPLVMVGDLTYDVELMEEGRVPGVGDKQRLQRATEAVNALRNTYPDLVVLPAHDPGAADRLNVAEGWR